jgi:hypothetical protein
MTGLSVFARFHMVSCVGGEAWSRRLSDWRIVRVIGLEAEYAAMAAGGSRPYTGLPTSMRRFPDRAVTVSTCGRICFNRQKINLRSVFAGHRVG